MHAITAWLIAAAIILILALVLFFLFKAYRSQGKEIKRLTAELEAQKLVSEELCFYAEQIARINGDKDEDSQKIREAKNNEEVLAVVAGLVRSNNDKLHQ